MKEEVVKIIEIGNRGCCTESELYYFLPNYPSLRGSEFIFTISWANSSRYINNQVEYFVKGLHCIEMKYKEVRKSDFGFGSPSPTSKVLSQLSGKNKKLADELTSWVTERGGNYYINR